MGLPKTALEREVATALERYRRLCEMTQGIDWSCPATERRDKAGREILASFRGVLRKRNDAIKLLREYAAAIRDQEDCIFCNGYHEHTTSCPLATLIPEDEL